LGRVITSLDFREPSGIVSVNLKILDPDNMGFVVWNNISHLNAKLLQNPDSHKRIMEILREDRIYLFKKIY